MERDFSDKTIRHLAGFCARKLGCGYSAFAGQVSMDELLAASIAVKSARGSYYDQFRGRVIFLSSISGETSLLSAAGS